MKKENNTVIEYELTETELIQNVTRQNGALETKVYKYSMLDSAEEKKNEFIIYVTKMQVFLLPKKDIIEGTPEELSALLRNGFGSKFKKLN
ncbi:YcxB family protein [Methanimicrococcus stummii]|nr:YcxB family protein [Methanimicrococcus sp. Es2]